MKKVALVVSLLFVGGAVADSAPTSVGYVDNAIGALQNKISAVDTNTVLTHTNTAGEIGQKSIYDATGNYAEQQNVLVTAEVANAAVQNAIDTEFICTEWLDNAEHTNENCLIYEIRAAKLALMPTGYTPLEYIESTGTQYIDTEIAPNDIADLRFRIDVQYVAPYGNMNYAGFGTAINPKFWLKFDIKAINQIGIQAGAANTETIVDCDISNRNVLYMEPQNGIARVNGTEYALRVSSEAIQITSPIHLFMVNKVDSSYTYARLYSASIYDGIVPIGNFIPARRDSDDEIGMYDLVSNTFFTNSGSGTLIAGPELNVYLPNGQ